MDRDTSYSPKYCEIMWVGRDLAGHHIPPLTWHCPAQHWATSPCTMSTSPSSPSRSGGTAPAQGHHPRASQPSQSRNFSLHPTYTPPGTTGDHFLMSRPSQLRKIKMQPTGCGPIRYQPTQFCWPSPNPTSLATTQCGLVGQLEAVGPTDRHPTWLC